MSVIDFNDYPDFVKIVDFSHNGAKCALLRFFIPVPYFQLYYFTEVTSVTRGNYILKKAVQKLPDMCYFRDR